MPAEFPFDSLFDRERFRSDVSNAWRSSKNDDDTENYLRSRGLRYVIQAPQGMSLDEVSRIVRERLHPEFGVERLFEDFERSPAPEELRSYYLATLRGVLPQDLGNL